MRPAAEPRSDADRPGFSRPDRCAIGQAAAEFIESRINFERLPTERYDIEDFKLERMRSLLERLEQPQQQIPAVHIAGTKGKGSTAVMIAGMLQAGGHRVGLFTSPHMEHFSERMTVDGERPTGRELIGVLEQLQPAVAEMDRLSPQMRPTFFEVLTAMAWLHFRKRRVDIVVLETGLGGRLDATNVCTPRVCLITSISRDHERLLGSTLAAIAREKAGIIKPGIPVLSGVFDDQPRDVIRTVAAERAAALWELGDAVRWTKVAPPPHAAESNRRPVKVALQLVTPWRSHSRLESPLPGEHQAHNLALAVAAVDFLNAHGLAVPASAVVGGLQRVRWPLRIEVLRDEPLVIVDAAHNVASVEALLHTLQSIRAAPRILIFAVAKDKDAAGMLLRLAPGFDRVILTQFVQNPRAVPLRQLESIAAEALAIPWTTAPEPAAAWKAALRNADAGALICATGSFFLAAELRAIVQADSA